MRFHRNELPNNNDTTMVSITEVDYNMTIIRVRLLEYDDVEGCIMFSSISKKLKAINKFKNNKGRKPFPCSVYNVEGGIPNLSPVKGSEECELIVNRYECFGKLESLTDDFIFQNKHIDPASIYEQFLWTVAEKLCEQESIKKDQFTYYLEHLSEMFAMSALSDENISAFKESMVPRITCSDLVLSSAINIMVISSHGLSALNDILSKLCEGVEAVYYQDAPSYKLTVKGNSEKECRKALIELSNVLQQFAVDSGVKAIVEYDVNNESVKSKIIRLATINKTGQSSDKHKVNVETIVEAVAKTTLKLSDDSDSGDNEEIDKSVKFVEAVKMEQTHV